MSEIKLWTERGIPYSEVRRRLSERSYEDCLTASDWIRQSCGEDVHLMICRAAEHLRDAQAVLDLVEDKIAEGLGEDSPAKDHMLEVHALMVEGAVRASNKLFPEITGKN